MKNNNYLSLWIANFGVEPLFSIAFFLLRPEFFSLNFLLTLVCVVLDAITLSLKKFIKSVFRSDKLTILFLFVKVFINTPTFASTAMEEDIFLSRGEQKKIKISSLKKFSVGNKEVISTTYRDNYFFIKGKTIGFSDIVVSTLSGQQKIKVFVVNKRDQLKAARIAQSFKSLDLSVQIDENLISLKGVLSSKQNYIKFMSLISDINTKKIIDVSLDLQLRNLLIRDIYHLAYRNNASYANCENISYQIYCSFRGMDFRSPRVKQIFKDFYLIRIPHKNISSSSNYKVSFKIFKVNKSNQKIRDLGPSKISAGLKNLLNNPLKAIFDGDIVDIHDSTARAKAIAQPIAKTILNEDLNLNLGGEFPVITSNQNGPTTSWKFYGLKLKSKIKLKEQKIILKYSTDLSTPFEENISTTGGDSSLYVPEGKYIELFKINFDQKKLSNESIPFINKLPILRHLFASKNKTSSAQEIIFFVKVEVQDE